VEKINFLRDQMGWIEAVTELNTGKIIGALLAI